MGTARFHLSLGNFDAARDVLMIEPSKHLNPCTRTELYLYRALVEIAMGQPQEANAWIRRSVTSRRVESRALSSVLEAVLARPRSVSQTAAVDFVLTSGCHDAIVIGCRAAPSLGVLMAGNPSHREKLEDILLRSRDEALARSLGLYIPRTTRRTGTLSPRELEVFELLAQGLTNRQIAQSLFITESTTKIHVRHIFEKLGVRTRVEAAQAWPGSEST
jgi:DNA-binding NarL/FixJ family response regulator